MSDNANNSCDSTSFNFGGGSASVGSLASFSLGAIGYSNTDCDAEGCETTSFSFGGGSANIGSLANFEIGQIHYSSVDCSSDDDDDDDIR